MTTVPSITLNNGVEMPALGLGVFQTPPTRPPLRSWRRCRPGTRTSTPPPPTRTSAVSARRCANPVSIALRSSSRPRSGSATTATTRRCMPSTRAWASSASTRSTSCILHQALPSDFQKTLDAYRALETLLADGKVRAIGVSNFMVDHLDALREHASVVPAVNQIEVHPYFAQRAVQARNAEQQDPHAGVVADRRHHLLSRRQPRQHPAGPGHRRDRCGPRQDGCSGHAALAPPAGPRGRPEVDPTGADRRERRRLRFRAQRPAARRDRCARHRPARWAGARRHHPRNLRTDHPRSLTAPAPTPATHRRPKAPRRR